MLETLDFSWELTEYGSKNLMAFLNEDHMGKPGVLVDHCLFRFIMFWLGFEPLHVLFLPAETPFPHCVWLLYICSAGGEGIEQPYGHQAMSLEAVDKNVHLLSAQYNAELLAQT